MVLFGRLAESCRACSGEDVEGRIRTRRWRGRDRYTTADMQGSVLRVLGGGRSYGSVRVQSAGLQSMARIQQYLGSSTAKPC